MRDYMKKRIKQESLSGAGGVRVNQAGCLDRCELGPVIVVYPEGVWYTYLDEEDIDDIIEQHIKQGQPVKRLLID
jgi:(2Fe-2S) ferredoxin